MFKGGNVMAKLEDAISRFLGSNKIFGNGLLILIVLVFLVICTDILDNFFEDDSMWIWIILIILLLFNFDESCY
jgi:uncharacterized membrane protein YoaK (UPF0700 family)